MDPKFLEGLKSALQDLNNRVSNLEHTVNDVVIKSLMEANDEYEYQDGLDNFRNTYSEKLEPLLGKMKALYGEDYDGYKDLYDTMSTHKDEEGFDEGEYVAHQIEEVNAKLDALAQAVTQQISENPENSENPTEKIVSEGEQPTEEVKEEIPSEEQLMEELKNA